MTRDKTFLPLAQPAGSAGALEDAARAFNLYCQEAGGSAQSIGVATAETVRKSTQQTLQFLQELAGAQDIGGALGLQLAFAASQMQLFMEQSRVLQCQLARLFFLDAAAGYGEARRS